ncbi:DUF2249 domain-containing protein [Pseudochelatococcus lubricantis]|uniref:DUF2249 domain-containing protein n=1 Tax=Pseudochelatococcus lubricantis TaxID=1538102 RepID=UPI0035EFAF0B
MNPRPAASLPATRDLDVRLLIRAGREPFTAIMAATDALAPGERLRLIAPFRPAPLFDIMTHRGFSATDRQLPGGAWEVIFTPIASPPPEEGLAPGSCPGATLWPEPVAMLDLTGVAPPGPKERILEVLDGLTPGDVLFALLDGEPGQILPELAMHGHEWAGNLSAAGDAYRLLVRKGAGDE